LSWTVWATRTILVLDAVGYVAAIFIVPRIILERRHPSATLAWFLSFVLFPALSVPLYFMIGARRVRRRIRAKRGTADSVPSREAGRRIPPGAIPGDIASACARVLLATGSPPARPGNRVALLETGREAWDRLEALVASARDHLHAQFFILDADPVGARFVEILAARAREGVRVRLLLDDVGSWRSLRGIVNPLRKAGGEVTAFLPALPLHRRGAAHLRNHRKLLVADGARAFTGGMNVGSRYLSPAGYGAPPGGLWKDRALLVEGPAVADLQSLFLDDWAFATGESRAEGNHFPHLDPIGSGEGGGSLLQVAPSGPDRATRPIYQGVFAAIVSARRRLWLETPYFVPDDAIATALKNTAMRGVDVRLLVPEWSDMRAVTLAGRSWFDDLLRSGVRIFQYGPGVLHAKGIVSDDEVAGAGSANADLRSFFLNFELGLFFYDRATVAAVAAAMERDFAACAELSRKEFSRRSFAVRFAEDTCRVFSPLF
jgi:cardiolipin synthase